MFLQGGDYQNGRLGLHAAVLLQAKTGEFGLGLRPRQSASPASDAERR